MTILVSSRKVRNVNPMHLPWLRFFRSSGYIRKKYLLIFNIDVFFKNKSLNYFLDFDHHARADVHARWSPQLGGRGLRRAAPLGGGTLATRMGPAHQKSYRRASSDALLALSRHRGGRFAARSKAPQEQLHIAAAAALPVQRYAAAQVEGHIFLCSRVHCPQYDHIIQRVHG
jgi:hypothetical protein